MLAATGDGEAFPSPRLPGCRILPLGHTSDRYLRPWSSPSLCLDVQNGSDDNGNLLQQYPCTGGRNQIFYGLPLISS